MSNSHAAFAKNLLGPVGQFSAYGSLRFGYLMPCRTFPNTMLGFNSVSSFVVCISHCIVLRKGRAGHPSRNHRLSFRQSWCRQFSILYTGPNKGCNSRINSNGKIIFAIAGQGVPAVRPDWAPFYVSLIWQPGCYGTFGFLSVCLLGFSASSICLYTDCHGNAPLQL